MKQDFVRWSESRTMVRHAWLHRSCFPLSHRLTLESSGLTSLVPVDHMYLHMNLCFADHVVGVIIASGGWETAVAALHVTPAIALTAVARFAQSGNLALRAFRAQSLCCRPGGWMLQNNRPRMFHTHNRCRRCFSVQARRQDDSSSRARQTCQV